MPISDIIFVMALIFFTIKGWIKGFFVEFFTFAGFVGGFLVAMGTYETASLLVFSYIGSRLAIIKAAVFSLTFILVVFVCIVIGSLLSKKMEKYDLEHVDSTLGTLFGFAQGVLILGLGVLLVTRHPVFTGIGAKVKRGSYFVDLTQKLIHWLEKALSG